jgi:hypothetical protein
MAAGKIFVCYRREDSAGHAGRLYDRLNQRFPGRVFMDVTGIDVGTRWAEVIEQTLGSCEVAVILIGRRWLERAPSGNRRLDDPEDSLRAEITTALRLRLKVVPLLVAGAAVPEHHELPSDVAPIVGWQALRIDDDDFDHDSARLIKALEGHLKDQGTEPRLDSADAKQSEIRRLLESAESCIARSDWVTAAQILQSVLSLDRQNAEAAARLRFVQQQSTRTYRTIPAPAPPKRSAGRWAALGIAGIVGGIVAFIAVILIVAAVLASRESGNTMPNAGQQSFAGDASQGPPSDPKQAVSPDPKASIEPQAPAAPSLAGDYVLTSFTYQGQPVPLRGAMRLIPLSEGRFQFATTMTNHAIGVTSQYHGLFEGQGANWTTTTLQTNDPGVAVSVPVPTQVRFDGSTLMVQNPYGQFAVWQRQ